MSFTDKAKNAVQKAKGKVKKAAGKVTDNERLKAEGKSEARGTTGTRAYSSPRAPRSAQAT